VPHFYFISKSSFYFRGIIDSILFLRAEAAKDAYKMLPDTLEAFFIKLENDNI